MAEEISVNLPEKGWGIIDLKSRLSSCDSLLIGMLLPQYGRMENLILLINGREVNTLVIDTRSAGFIHLRSNLVPFGFNAGLDLRLRYTHRWETDPLKLTRIMI